jgi:cytoskeletal protein RodZ
MSGAMVQDSSGANLYGRPVNASGSKDVTTAGTAEALVATATAYAGVYIKAKRTNTGLIYVGDSAVDNTGFQLAPGEREFFPVADLSTVYIDSAVNGEGVSFQPI